jgi:hypothetical protein
MDERRQLEKALREDSDGAVRKALGHILEWSEKVRSSLPKE